MINKQLKRLATVSAALGLLLISFCTLGSSANGPYVERLYDAIPAAPRTQSVALANEKSAGCLSCHMDTDSKSMHESPGVILGCIDCHGGNADVFFHEGEDELHALEEAHVLPSYPSDWNFPNSANPSGSYTLLNREAKEFVRFVNPSDLRVAEDACGACHLSTVQAAKRSIMASGALFYGAASYANGILPFKKYILGEAYDEDGGANAIQGPPLANPDKAWEEHGVLPILYLSKRGSSEMRSGSG